jgi:hypothetical protein
MEAPIILAHIAQSGRNSALRRNCVRAGRENFGDAGSFKAVRSHAESCAQSSAASANHDNVISVIDNFVRFCHNEVDNMSRFLNVKWKLEI